ncbi:class I SAM-dependent methyltransferase [Streptomyces himalayensis]|uniref:Methyltransferase domain-containing protein n=1 Tax=Streptomyces himalayensis subsp. himalayensis TaxID=2756131 RepID=A0A7W0DQZ1_9ACTN|nr:class I SAM-dependent methyltransferase [Streptomyces himalayensis]MBA2949576.1 methyltransferase domain-containing protein [Streptomyces himalayensis subsp. himalayensis]
MVDTGENVTQRVAPPAVDPAAGVQAYYAQNAGRLGQRYGSVTFEEVHGGVLDLLPPVPARVVDIGAGTGRDAAALAARGYQVVAAEPVRELREVAQQQHPSENVSWAEDSLPELSRLDETFDLALLSAVWMHLPLAERGRAMERLAALLAPAGLLVISLRRGDPPTDRVMFDVPAEDVVSLGERAGLRLVRLVEEGRDRLGRADVWWQTVVLRKGEG